MTKNVEVVDQNSRPLGRTYPRRAEQLVKKGRAKWITAGKIISMTPSCPSDRTEDPPSMTTEKRIDRGMAVDKELIHLVSHLVLSINAQDDLTTKAIDAIVDTIDSVTGNGYVPPEGHDPAASIAEIYRCHLKIKTDLLAKVMEFVESMAQIEAHQKTFDK